MKINKHLNKYASFIGTLIVLAGILTFAYFFVTVFLEANKEYKLIFLSAIGWCVAYYLARRKEIDNLHFSKKAEVYMKLIKYFSETPEMLKNQKLNQQKIKELTMECRDSLTIWGSYKLIQIWNKFQILHTSKKEDTVALYILEDLYKEIRKDLGHKDKLNDLDLVQMGLSDDVSKLKRKK